MREFFWGRYSLYIYCGVLVLINLILIEYSIFFSFPLIIFLFLFIIGTFDLFQKKRAILSNFPLLGRWRFFLESIRPELRQYYWEADDDELPYSRNQRSMVYQRAKNESGVRPFGSLKNMYIDDFVWLNHSIVPSKINVDDFKTKVGQGKLSHDMSVLNISGTSFGAISPPAIESLNKAARIGNFTQNTGEGSLSKYHEKGKGDLVWQISSGYYGCRDLKGNFCDENFKKIALKKQVKMIEIKLSQGAKPGHGGMLLGSKVTDEIAKTRGIKIGEDCVSPANHKEFSTPLELLKFLDKLRNLSGGKPIGIKLCVGHPWEFISIVKAMVETKVYIDFITVDGAEGGTGAAPVEFSDHLGCPLLDAVVFVENTLIGANLREKIKIGASGKIVSGFDIAHICALGADWVNMARPFMFSIGCIQCRSCHTGECPTGIATMDPLRYRAIDIKDRSIRASNFHKNTLKVLKEFLEAAGVKHTHELNRRHIVRRLSESEIKLADQVYPNAQKGELLKDKVKFIKDPRLKSYWARVDKNSFNFN